jgi:hypothetical protein
MPFVIQPTALYSKADLVEMLQPFEINVDHFLARVQCVKRFRSAWLGEDLLQAIRTTTPLAGKDGKDLPEITVKGRRNKKGDLIGGVFSPVDLGISRP